MPHDVGAPTQIRGLLREVEPRLDLRQPGSLAVADVVSGKSIRAGRPWPRPLHRCELQLHSERCSGGAQVLIEKHAREPPADLTARAVSGWEGDVRDRKSTRLNSSHLVISYAVF